MKESFLDNLKAFSQSTIKSLEPPFPKRIMLEITNRCNHRCIFCAHSSMRRKPSIMDLELCERILRECKELGSEECALHGGSEPFLHADIDKIIAFTKKYSYKYVYLSTNGTACTKEKMTAALEAGLDSIKFSINGGTPEEYKATHGVDGYDRAIKMLEHVIAWRNINKSQLKIYISAIQCPNNKNLIILKERYDNIIDAVELIDVDWTGKTTQIPKDKTNHQKGCVEVFNRTTFTADGGMRICCNDADNYLLVDSILHKEILQIWKSKLYKKMRQCFLEGSFPKDSLCHACATYSEHKIKPLIECFEDE